MTYDCWGKWYLDKSGYLFLSLVINYELCFPLHVISNNIHAQLYILPPWYSGVVLDELRYSSKICITLWAVLSKWMINDIKCSHIYIFLSCDVNVTVVSIHCRCWSFQGSKVNRIVVSVFLKIWFDLLKTVISSSRLFSHVHI